MESQTKTEWKWGAHKSPETERMPEVNEPVDILVSEPNEQPERWLRVARNDKAEIVVAVEGNYLLAVKTWEQGTRITFVPHID